MAATEMSISNGTLTWAEFLTSAKQFLSISTLLNDGWTVKSLKDLEEPDTFYLEKRTVLPTNIDLEDNIFHQCEEIISLDHSTIHQLPRQLLTYEYHIVYSIAYSTPVLYFTAWTQNGHVLTLEEIWDKINSTAHQPVSELKWSTVTQQIHPVLKRPFYQLHPCRTSSLMKLALTIPNEQQNHAFNYLVCWLSTMGSIVGLTISTEYGKTLKSCSIK